ncbi:MAG: hypothetical protein HY720_12185 [Planctomycetes bacterium]|nr:hypothetical protein [Planctomycetota bacterium]
MEIFFVVLISLTALGLVTVEERVKATRMAYELGELRQKAREEESANRRLREEAARLQTPARLLEESGRMNLGLEEPRLPGMDKEGSGAPRRR